MEAIYYLCMFLFPAAVIGAAVALAVPKLFKKPLKRHATRPRLFAIFLILIIITISVAGATEPASVKQARLDREHQKQEQRLKDEEAKRLASVKATTPDQPAPAPSPSPTAAPEPAPQPAPKSAEQLALERRNYWHKVTYVIDGDTVKAMVDGKEESIRIIGIDSPEATTTHECFGNESTAKAREFLNNKWIQLEADNSQGARDKYGRLLAYVWFDNGTDFGRRMVEEGFAYEYTYAAPYAKQAQYRDTQNYSKSKQFGLWAPNTCNGQKIAPQAASPNCAR